jgi:SRSO17 transposase
VARQYLGAVGKIDNGVVAVTTAELLAQTRAQFYGWPVTRCTIA